MMSGVRMLHFLNDRWKFIHIHQYYTMALELYNKSNFRRVLVPFDRSLWS